MTASMTRQAIIEHCQRIGKPIPRELAEPAPFVPQSRTRYVVDGVEWVILPVERRANWLEKDEQNC